MAFHGARKHRHQAKEKKIPSNRKNELFYYKLAQNLVLGVVVFSKLYNDVTVLLIHYIKKKHPKVPSSDLNHFNFNNIILQLQIYL